MIRRVNSPSELSELPKTGIEAQKIRALLQAYGTGYDFCRFYSAEGLIMARFYDEFVICTFGNADFEELCEFLSFSGFLKIFCSEYTGEILSKKLTFNNYKLNLMRLSVISNEAHEQISELSLSEAYSILKTSFEIDYEPWYLDMSHRVRHGISWYYGFNGSVLCVQHNLCGEALLSQIATIPEMRNKGNASSLIKAVCQKMSEIEVFLLCEDKLLDFYKKAGFEHYGIKCEISRE
ncbi:MAG: GNAT family N-acetyltransferase [Oscillospiraceae bacterium]|nr:GNAT family N-acetyltransferase [Oscillospiraceae bacterium]